jgi:hypothetical protein
MIAPTCGFTHLSRKESGLASEGGQWNHCVKPQRRNEIGACNTMQATAEGSRGCLIRLVRSLTLMALNSR